MIICNSRKFIFVHIHKTAGTSVCEGLAPILQWNDLILGATPIGDALNAPFNARFGLNKHSTARDIRDVVGPQVWDAYTSFAVVRDPVDRVVSLYRYLRMLADARPRLHTAIRRHLLRRPAKWPGLTALEETDGFSEFIRHTALAGAPGFQPQADWLTDDRGDVLVERILSYGRLAEEYGAFCRDIGVDAPPLPQRNLSKTRARVDVSSADAAFLRERFSSDYELLGRHF